MHRLEYLKKVIEYLTQGNIEKHKILLISEENNEVGKVFIDTFIKYSIDFCYSSVNDLKILYKKNKNYKNEITICLICTKTSLSYSNFVKELLDNSIRIISMPTVDMSMIRREILLLDKYGIIRTKKLYNELNNKNKISVRSELGTNIEFSIVSRKPIGSVSDEYEYPLFCNLPQGEVAIAPQEDSINGIIVVDGCVGKDILKNIRITLEFKEGILINLSISNDENGYYSKIMNKYLKLGLLRVGEFGIGTNSKAILTNSGLENEKVFGTCHFGMGNNIPFGGRLDINGHIDFVILKPTIRVDEKEIINKGIIKEY
ncbi:MAG: aminopeptidase [Clostridium sp.]|uniref:aminopeptidase n=1 Tax=Clostridium sp. TaxID=1506 RepID=UPI003EE4C437